MDKEELEILHEDDIQELEILKEGILHIQKALSYFSTCDTVTDEEYKKLMEFEDELTERKEDLERKLDVETDGYIIQED